MAIGALVVVSRQLFDLFGYDFALGYLVAPIGGFVAIHGARLVWRNRPPFALRIDEHGVRWRNHGSYGSVAWPDIVRIGVERRPLEHPGTWPTQVTIWLRAPLRSGPGPDVELKGLVGYHIVHVAELTESRDQVNAVLRRYDPAAGPARPPAAGECAVCASTPAASARFVALLSVLLWYRTSARSAWLCRDCGLAIYRQLTARTLVGGWWGAGVIGVPMVLGINRFRLRPVLRLAPPQRTPGVAAEAAAPLDPGRPVLARPAGVFGLVMVVIVLVLVCFGAVLATNPPS